MTEITPEKRIADELYKRFAPIVGELQVPPDSTIAACEMLIASAICGMRPGIDPRAVLMTLKGLRE